MDLIKKFFAVVGAMALCLAVTGPVGAITITFEDLPVDTVVTDQYSSLGVTFSLLGAAPLSGPPIYPLGGYDHVILAGGLENQEINNDIQLTFTSTINYLSFLALDADEPLYVRTYRESRLIESKYFRPGSNLQVYLVEFGDYEGNGSFFDRVVIDVTESAIPTVCTSGGPEGYDNFVFARISTPPPPPPPPLVPVPGTLIFFGSGLFFLAGFLRKSR
jgi:hypothetical protein